MTTDERFERIETNLAGVTAILRTVAENQARQSEALIQITECFSKFDQSDARMKRIEENLDGLIRAITADHSNGKKH
jgi:predicted transcriptional regulator